MHTLHIVGGQYPFPWISALGCRLIQETFIECQQRPGSVVSLPLEQAAHYSQNSKERGAPLLCISIIYKKNESLFNYLFFLIHALCPQWLWIREIKILKAKLLTSLLLSGRFKCHCSLESI